MARSLMELYGGGMVYPANNYQLGGVIAGSRRRRGYQGEMRELRKQHEKDAKERQRAGMWGSILGTVGGIAGSVFGPVGTGIGAGLGRRIGEQQYKTTKIGKGKYAQQTREDIREGQKEFKSGRGERAIVAGLQSAVMSKAFGEIGKGISEYGGDVGMMRAAMEGTGGATFEEAAKGVGRDPNWFLKSLVGAPSSGVTPAVPVGAAREQVATIFGESASQTQVDAAMARGLQQQSSLSPLAARPQLVEPDFSGLFDESSGRLSVPGFVDYGGLQGGGLIDYMMPRRMQAGGYATATDPLQALEQMGFEGIAEDPRLREYMEDLPQFQQGYAQQVGAIATAGQQQMGQIGTQMRQQQARAGFAGAGIGAGAAQQARAGVGREFQRGRRGIVEGFQADLLGAIGDIEAKGEFEFGGGGGAPIAGLSSGQQQYQAQDPWYQLGFQDEASWQNWVNAGSDYSQLGAYGGSGQAAQQNLTATVAVSDVRLKKDVHRLFTMKNNVPIYMFKYKWSDDINIGTMAQDIEGFMPEAVGEISGYKTVNYDIVFNS